MRSLSIVVVVVLVAGIASESYAQEQPQAAREAGGLTAGQAATIVAAIRSETADFETSLAAGGTAMQGRRALISDIVMTLVDIADWFLSDETERMLRSDALELDRRFQRLEDDVSQVRADVAYIRGYIEGQANARSQP